MARLLPAAAAALVHKLLNVDSHKDVVNNRLAI